MSKWIWLSDCTDDDDEYAEFFVPFTYANGNLTLKISANTDYAVYCNGRFVYAGQYADFPWYKIYDEIDFTSFVIPGQNEIRIIAYHEADCNSTHYIAKAGVRFSLCCNDKEIATSSVATLSREAPYFVKHLKKMITPQLGYSFALNYQIPKQSFSPSVEVEGMAESLKPRPIQKMNFLPKVMAKPLPNHVYDFGREMLGFPDFTVQIPAGETLTVIFGEWLTEEGNVPQKIGPRDFSFEITGDGREHHIFNPFRRLGFRYLQFQGNAILKEVGMIPLAYPFQKKKRIFSSPLDQKIYDTAVRTLELNAADHYFDCPWREQSFYALDSRFQMRYGYHAFEGSAYQRAALKLMSEDRQPNQLISLTVPSSFPLFIPSFALYYVIAMQEYASETGDVSLLQEYHEKLVTLLHVFLSHKKKDGLIHYFHFPHEWDFYEWIPLLDGSNPPYDADSVLQFDTILTLQSMVKIEKSLGNDTSYYEKEIHSLQEATHKIFYDKDKHLYRAFPNGGFAELPNAYAVLTGTGSLEERKTIGNVLMSPDSPLTSCTLSMLSVKYDALLALSKNNLDWIKDDIRKKYGYMLDQGATSFWETMLGAKDFDGAGSLCHGWSALPVYYLTLEK